MDQFPSLHERALMSTQNVQNDFVYGKTILDTNNTAGGLSTMKSFQERTLTNANLVNRMKRKIIVRRDQRVHESITLNSL